MATTVREDSTPSNTARTGDAKKREPVDLEARALADELLTPEQLRQRQERMSETRRPAGPELVAPAAGALAESVSAEPVPPTDVEEPTEDEDVPPQATD